MIYQNAKYGSRNRVWTLLMGDIPKKLKGTTDDTFYTRKHPLFFFDMYIFILI